MIIIEPTKSLTQPYKVRYTGRNNEPLSNSELLKSKKACWKNIYASSLNFVSAIGIIPGDALFEVKDTTVPNPEVFVYDINGIKKKAGVRK